MNQKREKTDSDDYIQPSIKADPYGSNNLKVCIQIHSNEHGLRHTHDA